MGMPDDSLSAPRGALDLKGLEGRTSVPPGGGQGWLAGRGLHTMPLLASLFRRPEAGRSGARLPRPQAKRFRPGMETLEDRTVPVLISSQVGGVSFVSSQVGGVSFVFSNVNSFVATFVQSTQATNSQGFVPVACPSNVPSQFQDCIQ